MAVGAGSAKRSVGPPLLWREVKSLLVIWMGFGPPVRRVRPVCHVHRAA